MAMDFKQFGQQFSDPIKRVGGGLNDIANGKSPFGGSGDIAPNVEDYTGREAFEAYKSYNVEVNLRAGRMNLLSSIIDRFSGIFFGIAATSIGVLVGFAGNSANGMPLKDRLAEGFKAIAEAATQTGASDATAQAAQEAFHQNLLMSQGTAAATPGIGMATLAIIGPVIGIAIALTLGAFALKQFTTRDYSEMNSHNGDFAARRGAKLNAMEMQPVVETISCCESKQRADGKSWKEIVSQQNAETEISEAQTQR